MKVSSNVKHRGDAQKAIKDLRRAIRNIDVLAGVPRDTAPYPDGTSTALVASVHEFGSPSRNIPERSYLRSTFAENQEKYIGMARRGLQSIVDAIGAGETPRRSLPQIAGLIGLQVVGDVQEKIEELKDPPLRPETIDRRVNQSDNPLVDTGHLMQSIRHEVRSRS